MLGIIYLSIALGCWTVWAVLSARLGCKFSPLNSLLWTGLVYAAITFGGFVVHHRQLRMPCGNDWWLLGIFCIASTAASLGYYAAMHHLPSTIVLPLSHLYLVLGPVLLAVLERRSMTWAQLSALGLIIFGVLFFLAVTPSEVPATTQAARDETIRPAPDPMSAAGITVQEHL